jgi:Ni2+-binding GTPase involved in maturation of urease and hydrogenase
MSDDPREGKQTPEGDPRTIVVVGPCAAGKTTLVGALVARGYTAYAIAQEHSIIKDLWAKRDPDVLIALDLDLAVVRERRSPSWSADIYAVQHERLQPAFESADLLIDTGRHDIEAALRMTLELLESTRQDFER